MLTKTTETAVKALIHLVLLKAESPVSPKQLAQNIGTSPTYLAKIAALLARAGILRSYRGAQGGVLLAGPPEQVTLLAIVEACQGRILANYCQPYSALDRVCGYHEAMHAIHEATTRVLAGWSLADLAQRPQPHTSLRSKVHCRMSGVIPK
jgi:Rrf2 family protein